MNLPDCSSAAELVKKLVKSLQCVTGRFFDPNTVLSRYKIIFIWCQQSNDLTISSRFLKCEIKSEYHFGVFEEKKLCLVNSENIFIRNIDLFVFLVNSCPLASFSRQIDKWYFPFLLIQFRAKYITKIDFGKNFEHFILLYSYLLE